MAFNILVPEVIITNINELNELVKKNPKYITPKDASKFLGMDDECLRQSMANGSCPFGISWVSKNGTRGFKIPTVKFYLWCMDSIGIQVQQTAEDVYI